MAYCTCCGKRDDLSKPECQGCLKRQNEIIRLCAKKAKDSGFSEENADNAISNLILYLIKPTNEDVENERALKELRADNKRRGY